MLSLGENTEYQKAKLLIISCNLERFRIRRYEGELVPMATLLDTGFKAFTKENSAILGKVWNKGT